MFGPDFELTADDLVACYREGLFPMGEARNDERIFLVDPDERGIIPLEAMHVPSRLRRTLRADPFQIRADTAFADVVRACAKSGPGRRETWINTTIEDLYRELFTRGQAHSLECWREGRLVGGLYGVSIGGAFFGESMFSLARDASKVALAHLAARLRLGGYKLLDTQFMTGHLAQFGAVKIGRDDYLERLEAALAVEGDFYRAGALSGTEVLQAISQAS